MGTYEKVRIGKVRMARRGQVRAVRLVNIRNVRSGKVRKVGVCESKHCENWKRGTGGNWDGKVGEVRIGNVRDYKNWKK